MKKIANTLFGITLLLFASCGQGQIKTPEKAITKFTEFKSKEKFLEDPKIFYPGIADPKLKPILTEKLNLVVDDFKKIAKTGKATDEDYQNAIKNGLNRFSDVYDNLDTEDRERVCGYFEEIMDIIGLESSGGHLNNFMYGFDPTKKQ